MWRFPGRRAVGAKNAPQQSTALGIRKYQVFTEGRGTTSPAVGVTTLIEVPREYVRFGVKREAGAFARTIPALPRNGK